MTWIKWLLEEPRQWDGEKELTPAVRGLMLINGRLISGEIGVGEIKG